VIGDANAESASKQRSRRSAGLEGRGLAMTSVEWGAVGSRARPRTSRRGLIPRKRLVSRLLSETDVPAVLVAAPAGYGKTTILSQWEEADERPFVWLTLDERHNDPAFLLGSIVVGLTEIEPVDERVPAALAVPRPSISTVVIPRLCRSLRNQGHSRVIALDDVQRVDDPEALEALVLLATGMPDGSQLALASRDEPSIPLGRLRGHALVAELGAQDLVMTRSEARTLFEEAGVDLDGRAVGQLVERTEGWPVAIHLAALSLSGEENIAEAIESFHGDDRFVADYLRDEFLSRLTRLELDFLTRTSILERLTGAVCDAVLEREGSARILRRLARANLLLVPLDRRDEQYRYHSLLREMLASELRRGGKRRESELHARASRWYAEQGDVDHAVAHAIASGNLDEAGRLIWAIAADYESRGRTATLRRWFDRFTEEQVAGTPELCLALATTHLTAGAGDQVEHWTSAAERALERVERADSAQLRAAATVIRASGAAREGVAKMGKDICRAYERLSEDSPWRSLCRLMEGVSYHLGGHREHALPALEEGVRRGAVGAPTIASLCLAQLALLALDEDDVDGAVPLIQRAVAETDHYGLVDYPTQALVFAASALVRARRGLVDDATRDLRSSTRLLAMLSHMSPWYEAETRITLARAQLLLDEVPAARAHLADSARYLRQVQDAKVLREWLEQAWHDADSAQSVTGRWPLTPAELRLLHFLPTHLTFREIAEQVFVSTNTVKSQAQAIYRKLGVSSRAEAVACAQAAGLLGSSNGRQPPN
jgi:LuxR family transcriptional regulator, maltose regulon positive regulatory protein